MIPNEIPEHEVGHGFDLDDYSSDAFLQLGTVRTDLDWPEPDDAEVARFKAEIEDRERRRLPFGFRLERVAAASEAGRQNARSRRKEDRR